MKQFNVTAPSIHKLFLHVLRMNAAASTVTAPTTANATILYAVTV